MNRNIDLENQKNKQNIFNRLRWLLVLAILFPIYLISHSSSMENDTLEECIEWVEDTLDYDFDDYEEWIDNILNKDDD